MQRRLHTRLVRLLFALFVNIDDRMCSCFVVVPLPPQLLLVVPLMRMQDLSNIQQCLEQHRRLNSFIFPYHSCRTSRRFPSYCSSNDEWSAQEDTGPDDGTSKSIVSYNDFDDFELTSSTSSSSSRFYDDFDDQTVGGNRISDHDKEEDVVLSSRISMLNREEQRRVAVCDRNWKLGNWFVRGFSLETTNEQRQDSDRVPTPSVSVIATSSPSANCNDDDDIDIAASSSSSQTKIDVWVGRTDGTIFGIRLGTEYWTRLGNNNASDNDIVIQPPSVVEVDDGELPVGDLVDNDDEIAIPTVRTKESPFTIVTQFQSTIRSSAIAAIVAIPTSTTVSAEGRNDKGDDTDAIVFDIYTASKDSTNIEHFYYDGRTVSLKNSLRATQPNSIFTLRHIRVMGMNVVPTTMILAVTDCGVILWDVTTNEIVGCIDSIQIPDVPGGPTYSLQQTISCIDTDSAFIYIGTESGYVLVYDVNDLVQQKQPQKVSIAAVGCWRAAPTDDCSLTAINCGGLGTLGRNSNSTTSSILYTGDAQGRVKQWEVLKIVASPSTAAAASDDVRTKYKVEAWPKLSTQRLPKKAHTFTGHHDAITGLLSIDALKFVSASTDGSVRAWNTATGKEMFRMDGFPDKIGSLCVLGSGSTDGSMDRLHNTILVTNGMNKYVCIHDFSADDEEDADYDLDMPEYIK